MPTNDETLSDLAEHLVVGTMCHCDDPDECHDHWELFLVDSPDRITEDGHVSRARTLTPEHMRSLVATVRGSSS